MSRGLSHCSGSQSPTSCQRTSRAVRTTSFLDAKLLFSFLWKKNIYIIATSYSQFFRSDDAVILYIDCLRLSYITCQRTFEALLSNQIMKPRNFYLTFSKTWILSYSTTNKMHLLSQIIHSCKTLYMFRTVFPSIIRSSKLRIQQWYISNSCCYLLLSG